MKSSASRLKHAIPSWGELIEAKLTEIGALAQGWGGGAAVAPNETAMGIARGYLEELFETNEKPSRIGPAAFGGVAFVHERGGKEVSVGISNKGEIYAMFMDDSEVPNPTPFDASTTGYKNLAEKVRAHLG